MLHKIKVIYKVLHDYLLSLGKPKNAVFLNTEDTILYALNNRISLIRYGDGEFGFFEKRGVSYQVYEDNLENDFIENVVFVHNDIKYYNDFVQKYNFINCKYVKIPNKNSYQFIHQIEQDIKNNVTSINNTVILVSAGPAAKPIVRDLSNCGLWAIDTGHCWCDPLRDIE